MCGEQLPDVLAYVCAHEEEVRDRLAGLGRLDLWEDLLAALPEQVDVAPIVQAMHTAFQNARDALGLLGATRRDRPVRPAGTGPATPVEALFLCPVGRCTRFWAAEPGETRPPRCEMSGAPLRWEGL
ncbi:hypothetical protein AB0B01_27470 [Streptomyces sp. NPDC044571]|uniref:hypothetical protein n=1 Tax=Streptomyces sp. NPDC044571 TaxID=3155371 RepID=UPI0033E49654